LRQFVVGNQTYISKIRKLLFLEEKKKTGKNIGKLNVRSLSPNFFLFPGVWSLFFCHTLYLLKNCSVNFLQKILFNNMIASFFVCFVSFYVLLGRKLKLFVSGRGVERC